MMPQTTGLCMPTRRLHPALPFVLASAAALLPPAAACQERTMPTAPEPAPAGYRLVWADEFDGGVAPNPTRWSYDVGGGGWGNNELQFYTQDRRENARLDGGYLVIEARREPWEGREYTSARLVTRGKGDWTYARIEVRAQLPSGRGSWPAIWTLGSTTPSRWPDDGEIDIWSTSGSIPASSTPRCTRSGTTTSRGRNGPRRPRSPARRAASTPT
jgi:beta-glucanase (GH16 family)